MPALDPCGQIVADAYDDMVGRFREDMQRDLKALCERAGSPIESALGARLLADLVYLEDPHYKARWSFTEWDASKSEYLKADVWFYQQAKIDRYRADFIAKIEPCGGGQCRLLVIECDGHDFHERTKAQAARDRSRDRFMTLQGITVVRFTGSEICANVDECANEISQMIERLLVSGGTDDRR